LTCTLHIKDKKNRLEKKTILHIIHDLGRGGAETMLVTVVKELKEYNNIVVTLFSSNHFTADEFVCDKYISMSLTSVTQMPLAVLKLRKIIRQVQPDIVHTHLFWPTMLARLATPKRIPLITTIHAFIATSGEYKYWYIKWIDKITYHFRRSVIIAVAKGALAEYFDFLKLKPWRSHALYTFVNTVRFNEAHSKPAAIATQRFRLITVGRISLQKNHRYLVEAFKLLPPGKFELHIYGINTFGAEFEKYVQESSADIILKGEVKNINEIIAQYDLFVMSSTYEGFSLAVLEAMAMGMPLLLSDIASFKEQCEDTAVYFNLDDPQDFAAKLQQLAAGKDTLLQLAERSKQRALGNFTLQHHMQGLRSIYLEALSGR
jgi:L-malate glycosyltransferase